MSFVYSESSSSAPPQSARQLLHVALVPTFDQHLLYLAFLFIFEELVVTAPPTAYITLISSGSVRKYILRTKTFLLQRKKKADGFRHRKPGNGSSVDLSVMNSTIQKRLNPKWAQIAAHHLNWFLFFFSKGLFFPIHHCRPGLTGPEALISSRMWKWRHCNIINVITLISGRLGCSWEREPSIMNEENINYISSGTLRVPETFPLPLSSTPLRFMM